MACLYEAAAKPHLPRLVSSGTAGNGRLDEICIVLDGQHKPNATFLPGPIFSTAFGRANLVKDCLPAAAKCQTEAF
ncbi:hypothetical protein OOU_Y34scaffold00920g3 [Pyricularia oryzae Y34]|uniref:Uncharacterized protein n=2 Tax=Pyricularia oryzae TaxID=318829 RepID=A0AA97PGD5_PYRO3|nr:hypothetical protein OOU_Y34scaffold00920g3 [Pyricularia oryzae Y34]